MRSNWALLLCCTIGCGGSQDNGLFGARGGSANVTDAAPNTPGDDAGVGGQAGEVSANGGAGLRPNASGGFAGVTSGLAGMSGNGGSGGGNGGGGGSAGAPVRGELGHACNADTQCKTGLRCVTDAGAGVLPGGICTQECVPREGDAACAELRAGAVCVEFGIGQNYCVQGCVPGSRAACDARTDVFCIELSPDPVAGCIPFCTRDEQCPGLGCNFETGLCAEAGDAGSRSLGAACNPNATSDQCATGFCAATGESSGYCTAPCRYDVWPQCSWASLEEPASSICLGAGGPADPAFCHETCDCDQDCGNPGLVCTPDPELERFGKAGYCAPFTWGAPRIRCR